MMKLRHWITVVALLALVAATVIGMFFTEGGQTLLPARASKSAAKQPVSLVDQRPLQTARKLAALASTPEERDFANEAVRVADYEVDLAFADALREATEHPPTPTQEQRELMARSFKSESMVKADQELITQLTRQHASASDTANASTIAAAVQRGAIRPRPSSAVATGSSSAGVVTEPMSCHRPITLGLASASTVANAADTQSPIRV